MNIVKTSKTLAMLCVMAIMTGCASHAEIKMPAVQSISSPKFEEKKFHYEVYYSQPKPGVFSGGDQEPLKPLSDSELSISSSAVLKDLPNYITEQLPSSASISSKENSDYQINVELVANHKRGPVYANHELAKSLGKGILTLGLAPSDYEIIADFNVTYHLAEDGHAIYNKSYEVTDRVQHQRGDFESYNSVNDPAGQLLKKHIILTLNDFLENSTSHL